MILGGFLQAKLHTFSGELQKKPRQVYVYVSAKQVAVKEYYFGLIPSRVATYRVLPVTKVNFSKVSTSTLKNYITYLLNPIVVHLQFKLVVSASENGNCLVSISDRTQPTLVLDMDIKSCRIAMALFALFLKQRLGMSYHV